MARKPSRRRPRVPRPSLLQRARTNFLTGLVVVLPVALTIYIVWAVIGLVDSQVVPLIPGRYNPENVLGRNIFGLGVVVFLVFTTLMGAVTKGFVGRQVLLFAERQVERMPIVRTLYAGMKQIVETVLNQSGNSFRQACLVEFPRKDFWSIGFVVNEAKGELPIKTGVPDLVCVFIATTPNPTNGFLVYVPRREVIVLDMSLEEAAKLIMSAGLVGPAAPAPVATAAKLTPQAT